MDSAIITAVIGGVCTIAVTVIGMINTASANKSKKDKALRDGLCCLLRAEIIRIHDKYIERQEIPIYAKEALDRAYKAYHELGGNDIATALYEECMELPVVRKAPQKGGEKQ